MTTTHYYITTTMENRVWHDPDLKDGLPFHRTICPQFGGQSSRLVHSLSDTNPVSGYENVNRKSEYVYIHRTEEALQATDRLVCLFVFVSKWQGQLPPKVS